MDWLTEAEKNKRLASILKDIDRSGGPDACWPTFRYWNCQWGGARWTIQRLLWALANEFIPRGNLIHFDGKETSCCNPKHLQLSERDQKQQLALENYFEKTRENSFFSKFGITTKKRNAIRLAYNSGFISTAELSKKYSVSEALLKHILQKTGDPIYSPELKKVKLLAKHELIELNPKNPFGSFLRQSRIDCGYSHAQLAELIGCHTSSISHWESGQYIPWFSREKKIIGALRVDEDVYHQLLSLQKKIINGRS